jgi:hypothetical protein
MTMDTTVQRKAELQILHNCIISFWAVGRYSCAQIARHVGTTPRIVRAVVRRHIRRYGPVIRK